jgi:hypothetical protein
MAGHKRHLAFPNRAADETVGQYSHPVPETLDTKTGVNKGQWTTHTIFRMRYQKYLSLLFLHSIKPKLHLIGSSPRN